MCSLDRIRDTPSRLSVNSGTIVKSNWLSGGNRLIRLECFLMLVAGQKRRRHRHLQMPPPILGEYTMVRVNVRLATADGFVYP